MSKDVQVLHEGRAAQVEQVLALVDVAGASALPRADVRQIMFDGRAFA